MNKCRRCRMPLLPGLQCCPHCGARVSTTSNRLQFPCKSCGYVIQRRMGDRQVKCPRCGVLNVEGKDI